MTTSLDLDLSIVLNKLSLHLWIGLPRNITISLYVVVHKILSRKLYAYGIRGILLKWFESYLTDRFQYVIYDGVKSEIRPVECGVPQGSILGPLFFIISMNDICNVSDLMFAIMYADDTCFLLTAHICIELRTQKFIQHNT